MRHDYTRLTFARPLCKMVAVCPNEGCIGFMSLLDIFKKDKHAKRQDKKTETTKQKTSVLPAAKVIAEREPKKEPEVKEKTGRKQELKPVVSEKAFTAQGKGVYVFKVASGADKQAIKSLVHRIYKVRPLKVNIIRTADKSLFLRRRRGVKPGYKKALVYLREGETISIN